MRSRLGEAIVLFMGTLYAGLFSFISFRRHDVFQTWAMDLGNMDQAVWNTLHGSILGFTNQPGVTTRLGIHFEPTLILISPIYLLWSDPKALLLLQSVLLASGALPVYWLAKRELKNELAALVIAAAYLLFPSLEAVNLAEFHTVALSAPLLLWAIHFASRDRWLAFSVASLLAAGTKEEVGLVVALLGVYLAISERKYPPLIVGIAGAVWSLIAIVVVIPSFNPTHTSPYTGYYSYLGTNLVAVAMNLLSHPWIPAQKALGEPKYLESLLFPSGYLALLSPERLLIGLPSFFVNILSVNGEMQRPNLYHYTAPLIPAIFFATTGGIRRATAILSRVGVPAGIALTLAMALSLGCTVLYQRDEGFTPLAASFSVPSLTPHDRIGYEVMQKVPKDVSLSVHSDLNPHLSQRQKLYVFPRVEDAEYVLMDRYRDSSSRDVFVVPSDGHRERLRVLDELIGSGKWEVLVDLDGYVLLKRKGA